MENNIHIIFQDLPIAIKGFTIQCDDIYTIVLNSRLSYRQNRETVKHELKHITEDDFYSESDIQELETCRHETIQIH